MAQAKDHVIETLLRRVKEAKIETKADKTGEVLKVGDGIASLSGLSDAKSGEILEFPNKIFGVVLNLEEDQVGVIILGDYLRIGQGDVVKSTGKLLSVPVGEALVGRVVNALGEPIDGKGAIKSKELYPVEKIAPRVIERQSVNAPVHTGIKMIDSMIPIGRGQRELIIGDRQTGKTALAVDAIISQLNEPKKSRPVCIYVAIGQKEAKVASIVAELEKRGAMEHTIVVVAGASEPPSLSYIAPFAGCAMGEYFMDRGGDVLAIYDDLSKHAKAYRQISLLLRRPPGREAYPGDVFYLHSRLLERSARLSDKNGGGSLTALPIIETQAGDVSAYIPTNVISITDGQIYLESDLFYQGIRPALNVGLSVSRVGSAAQTKAMKKVAGKLRLDLAQYRELAAFAQFGADLEEGTRKIIERGKRVTEALKQDQYVPQPFEEQVAVIFAAVEGHIDDLDVESVKAFNAGLLEFIRAQYADVLKSVRDDRDLDEKTQKKLEKAIGEYRKVFEKEAKSA